MTSRFLHGVLFVSASVFLSLAPLSAQETDLRISEQPTDMAQFRPELPTRMGKVRFGEMPEQLDLSNSRVPTDAFRMGSFNTFLGVDPDGKTSRLGKYRQRPPLPPSDFLSETPVRKELPTTSANVPVGTQTAGSQSTPLRRPTNFFDRPDMPQDLEGSEESTIRTPVEQRWFRDIGRRPGLADRGGRARVPVEPAGSGEAIVGGPDLLQSAGDAAAEPVDPRRQVMENRRALAAEQANAGRRFEQKLEGMLLSSASVQFLSPVQVSFQNGVVTVRGIVPSQQHKIAAGNILLGDSAVKQVNNLISIVPADPGTFPKPIEPK